MVSDFRPKLDSLAPVLSASLVLCLVFYPGPNSLGEESRDPAVLVASARAVLRADLGTWAEYSFQRQVLRQRFDQQGAVTWSREYLFEVRPVDGGFDERLVRIDARQPTAQEVQEHRRAGRFEKHYRQAVAAKLNNPLGVDLPLLPLLFDQQHRYLGRETVRGVPCHRIAFSARPEPKGGSVDERLKRASQGALCISELGHHVVEAEVESVRPVGNLALRLEHLWLRFENQRVAGVWLPDSFETRSEFKLGASRQQKRNRYRYSHYRRP